jgi:hypothetical protein
MSAQLQLANVRSLHAWTCTCSECCEQMDGEPATPLPARRTDPDTSHAAAASVKFTELEDLVLEQLFANPLGLTTRQLAAKLNRDLVSISPRIRPLVRKRAVRDSGRRVLGASRREQIVWVPIL